MSEIEKNVDAAENAVKEEATEKKTAAKTTAKKTTAKKTTKSTSKTAAAKADTATKSEPVQEAAPEPAPAPVVDPEAIKKMEEKKKIMKEEYFKYGLTDEKIYDMIADIKDEDTKALAMVMLELKRGNDKEANYAKRQSIFSLCTAVLCLILVIVILVWGVKFVPTVEKLANEATELVENTNGLIKDTQTIVDEAVEVLDQATDMIDQTAIVVDNVENITADLAAVDIQGMMDNVNSLVVTSEASMEEAVEKIEDIDFDSLNQAIQDLQAVVEPLSKLFKK